MNDILQWTAVAVAVALAVVFLVRRLSHAKSGCGCGHCCDSCPCGDEFPEKCESRPR